MTLEGNFNIISTNIDKTGQFLQVKKDSPT